MIEYIAIVIIGAFCILTIMHRKDRRKILKTHCRCCGSKLEKQGGEYIRLIGGGFCVNCRDEITKL